MILELEELRARERDVSIVGAYRAAIDRLHGLAYRVETRPRTRVIGLPPKTVAPAEASSQAAPSAPEREPPPEPSQRTLPLGAVIVKARRPRRRSATMLPRVQPIAPVRRKEPRHELFDQIVVATGLCAPP